MCVRCVRFTFVCYSIADDYERHSQVALTDMESHLANPINAFLLVKRFTADWNQVEELITNNSATGNNHCLSVSSL